MAFLDEKQELKYVEQLRSAVKDLGRDDGTLRRFLRARDYDLNKAEEMLRKSMKWREENDMDGCRKWIISDVVNQSFPHGCYGVDHEGRPVYYFPVGSWEVRQMIESGHKDDMLKLMLYTMESIMERINKSSNDRFSLIIDLELLTYWKVAHYETIQMVLKVFRDFEQNYPERLGEAFVINAPMVLNYVWPLIKPLLTGHTMQKVRFLGSDCNKFIPELMEKMPADTMSPKLCTMLNASRADTFS
ncbi:unnamed protein product [Orchesella dallaii]|uniref:CRAL-TRIO domain-containing protein n=1 Tax=Orchesella dallaii TaxID=48710 RepID=A0ABP1QU62_9HEXA